MAHKSKRKVWRLNKYVSRPYLQAGFWTIGDRIGAILLPDCLSDNLGDAVGRLWHRRKQSSMLKVRYTYSPGFCHAAGVSLKESATTSSSQTKSVCIIASKLKTDVSVQKAYTTQRTQITKLHLASRENLRTNEEEVSPMAQTTSRSSIRL